MKEEWREVPGFHGYEVSNQPRVRSYKKHTGFGTWTIEKEPQRYLTLVPTSHKNRNGHPTGYRQLQLSHKGQTRHFTLHQLVALAWYGPCPEGMEVCHNDSNAANNRPSNLRYDVPEGNYEDRRRQTRARVQTMREEHAEGEPLESLAERYHLAPSTMQHILAGSLYRDAGGPTHSFRNYKLAKRDVVRMRNMRATGISLPALAEFFNVSESATSYITRGKRRMECSGPYTFRKQNADGSFYFEISQR